MDEAAAKLKMEITSKPLALDEVRWAGAVWRRELLMPSIPASI